VGVAQLFLRGFRHLPSFLLDWFFLGSGCGQAGQGGGGAGTGGKDEKQDDKCVG